MSALASLYIKIEKLKEVVHILEQKQQPGIELTLSLSDTSNEYGQNLSGYVSQTKEQRDEKKPKFYVGNGKVFWTDNKITIGKKQDAPAPAQQQQNDGGLSPDDTLPF